MIFGRLEYGLLLKKLDCCLINMEMFTYNIDETQCFKFQPTSTGFELFHKMEGSASRSLGRYSAGLWTWEEQEQKSLWFNALQSNGKALQRAFKAYYRQKPERTIGMTIHCARRRVSIKYNKFTDKLQNKMISTFYGTGR